MSKNGKQRKAGNQANLQDTAHVSIQEIAREQQILSIAPAKHTGREALGYGIGESWFESQETRIDKVLIDRHFWWDVLQHIFLPIAILFRFSLITENLTALRCDPSSKKLASIWLRKLVGFAAAWFAFIATIVVWKASGQDVSNTSDHLLRNISTVTCNPFSKTM